METFLSILVGVGLSAACGFRVFIPPLVISIASLSGQLQLSSGFEWMGTYPALISFAVASGLEIAGYFIPWVDHLLDSIATPAAVVAGVLVSASMIGDMSPMLKWTLAVIVGGGAAGLIQASTVVARAASTSVTGGLGNPLLATAELGGSIFTSIIAIVVPMAALLLVIGITGFLISRSKTRREPPRITA